MHIGRTVTHGLGQDAIDDLHDWSIVSDDHRGGGFGHALAGALHDLERLHELGDTADGSIVTVDGPQDIAHWGEQQSNRMTTLLCEKEAEGIARLGHRHMEPVVMQADRHGHVRTSNVFRNEGEGFWGGLVPPKACYRHA